ncbi:MAG: hypothetical protein M3Z36_00930 [Acidobacteriota bacterium]|nr:hypothetical protein [Acidobacteriota bacterium]
MTTYGFTVMAFGWSAAIFGDCEQTSEILNRYILPWLPRSRPDEGHADAVFRVIQHAGVFELHAVDGMLGRSDTAEGIVPILQSCIDSAVVQRLTDTVAVHAGAVSYGGAAILFPGPSHSGKSTLVAELLHHGFAYFSDEYALLDREGRAYPYPRSLMLRNGKPEARPMLVQESGAAIGSGPARVALVLALDYVPGAEWNVRPMPQSEMLLMLLKSTPHHLSETGALLGALLRASGGAACYAGVRGEAANTANRIAELLRAGK